MPDRTDCYALPVSERTLTKAALVDDVADIASLTKKRAEVIVESRPWSVPVEGPVR